MITYWDCVTFLVCLMILANLWGSVSPIFGSCIVPYHNWIWTCLIWFDVPFVPVQTGFFRCFSTFLWLLPAGPPFRRLFDKYPTSIGTFFLLFGWLFSISCLAFHSFLLGWMVMWKSIFFVALCATFKRYPPESFILNSLDSTIKSELG